MPERRCPMYRLPESVREAQRRIAWHMARGRRKGDRKGNPTRLVCAACGAPWETSAPGLCPGCGRYSYALSKGN